MLEYGELNIFNEKTWIVKRDQKKRLYLLDGEILTGESSVTINVVMNITRLWHLRLGHMSIKSLKMLGKQGVLRSDKLGDLKFCEG